MFKNLNIRWTIIACILIVSIYYLIPSYQLFSIQNDPDLQDIDTAYLKLISFGWIHYKWYEGWNP